MRQNREEGRVRVGLVGDDGLVVDPRYWGNMFRKEKPKQKAQSLVEDRLLDSK